MPEARIELELDEGALDAFVAWPDTPGRKPPILLLSGPPDRGERAESTARRLSAHNYFVLAPDLATLAADDRREAGWGCMDYLADERRVDDSRVGVLGFGGGGDMALRLAADRAERVAGVATYGGRGFGARTALEISQRINSLVRIGYEFGAVRRRAGVLEAALSLSGVLFDTEIYETEPRWPEVLDFFGRALVVPPPAPVAGTNPAHRALNP